jgi:phosphate transport system substrate-binding protein
MRRALPTTLPALALLALIGCGEPPPQPHRLVVSGSRELAPLLTEIGERFEKDHPDWRVDVDPASERGADDVRTGLADVGMLSRPLRPDENGLHAAVIARDGVAFLVHRDNPVQSLDDRQLVGLLTATYVNWKEVGGSDRPVKLITFAEGRPIREAVLEVFALPSSRLRSDAPVYSGEQAVAAVAADPGALGYTCLGKAVLASARRPVRLLPLRGVGATLAEVQASRYPLIRPMLLLTRDRPTGVVKEFIDFARSEAVRDLLDKHGLAPPP